MNAEKMFSYLENLVGEIPAIIICCVLATLVIFLIFLIIWAVVKIVKKFTTKKTSSTVMAVVSVSKRKLPSAEKLGYTKDEEEKYKNFWGKDWRIKNYLSQRKQEDYIAWYKRTFRVRWDVKEKRYKKAC